MTTERNHLTPVCISGYNALYEPQGYKGSPVNRYWSITVKMTKEQGDAFIKECQAIADKAFYELVEKRKKMGRPIHESVRPKPNYRTDEFGNYTISFRRKESKGTPPHVLDYNRVPTTKIIRNGDKVQVAFNLYPYVMPTTSVAGVSFELIAVRIMDQETPREEITTTFNRVADDKVTLEDLF